MNVLSRILFYFGAGVLALILLLSIAVQTPLFKGWLLDKIFVGINERINGTLTAGRLSGSLFTSLRIEDIALDMDDKPFLTVKRLVFEYSLLDMISRRLSIHDIKVEHPQVFLRQYDDNSWNFQAFLRPKEPLPVESPQRPESGKSSFNWDVFVESVKIRSGWASIERAKGLAGIPARINDFNLALGVSYVKGSLQATLQDLNFQTEEPPFSVKTIKSQVDYNANQLRARNLEIETDSTRFSSDLDIEDFKNPILDLLVAGKPLSFDEIRQVWPELKLYGKPRLDLEASGPLDDLRIKCGVRIGQGLLHVSGNIALDKLPYQYDLRGGIKKFDLAILTNDSTLASDLNIDFQLQGRGIEPETLVAELSATADSSVFQNLRIGLSTVKARLDSNKISLQAQAHIQNSAIDLAGSYNISEKRPVFSVKSKIRDFDLKEWLPDGTLTTDLNLAFNAKGRGNTIESLSGNLNLQVLPSSINGIALDSAQFEVQLDKQAVALREFNLRSPLGQFYGRGAFSAEHVEAFTLSADFSDFSILSPVLPADSIFGSGTMTAYLRGPMDSLFVATELSLAPAGIKDLSIQQMQASAEGFLTQGGFQFDINGHLDSTLASGTRIASADFAVGLSDRLSSFKFKATTADSVAFTSRGDFATTDGITTLGLDALDISYLDDNWKKSSERCTVTIAGDRFDVDALKLTSKNQTVTLGGSIDLSGQNDFTTSFSHIDVARYRDFLASDINLRGILDFSLNLTGSMQKPTLDGFVALKNGKYSEFEFERFTGNVGFDNGHLYWKLNLAKTATDSLLEASGMLPMELSLSPYHQKVLADAPLELKFSTRGLDISFLQAFDTGLENLSGILVADIILHNSLNDLRGVGPIRLINGQFDIPELGTSYRQFNIVVLLKEKELILQDWEVRSGAGTIKLVEGSLSLSDDGLEEFDSKFRAQHFELVNNKKMKARANGVIELGGSIQSPYVTGDLTIDEARIYYQSFEEETAVTLSSQPLFVIGVDTAQFDTSGALRFQKKKDIEEQLFTESNFYKNLTGELSFFFPRNVWIRSQDTGIEVEGDMVAVKEGANFLLFGSLSVIRGFYELLGNRFQIEKGELIFNGEAEINPEVSIKATTTITETKPDSKKQKFSIDVTGTLEHPEFDFRLDDKIADQEDVVAILLFGQPFRNLRPGQANEASEASDPSGASAANSDSGLQSRAKGLLTGQLLKQLSNRLGQQLRLDVIQIESGDETKIKVGKYVTPEVFVSVSQDFSELENQLVELEYEIPKKLWLFNLLLQASSDIKGTTTGLDAILKIDW